MPTRSDINRLDDAENGAVELARRDLDALCRMVSRLPSPEQKRDMLLEYVPAIVSKYGETAATAAAQWYEETRGNSTGDEAYTAVLGDGMSDKAVRRTVRWLAGGLWKDDGAGVARSLSYQMDRWVKKAGRDTIIRNARRDKAKWALIPRGAYTCAFCTMLASRGFAYTSEDTAKASQHTDCDCWPVPAWTTADKKVEGYKPDAMKGIVDDATAMLKQPTGEYARLMQAEDMRKGDTSRDAVLWMMRILTPDRLTDGVSSEALGTVTLTQWREYLDALQPRYKAAKRRDSRNAKLPEIPPRVPDGWPKGINKPTQKTWAHILYGSENEMIPGKYGGGHRDGYRWVSDEPGPRTFPHGWNEGRIATEIQRAIRTGKIRRTRDGALEYSAKLYPDDANDKKEFIVLVRDGIIRTAYPKGRRRGR